MTRAPFATSRLIVLAVLIASVAVPLRLRAQSGDPLDGAWRLSAARSAAAWQSHPQPKRSAPESQARGLITMKVDGTTMRYRVEHGRGSSRLKEASYTATFNDARWQPVHGTPERAYAEVLLVRINDRQHYWITRTQDGRFAGLTLRKLADDGRSFTSVGIDSDGYVQHVRVFERQ